MTLDIIIDMDSLKQGRNLSAFVPDLLFLSDTEFGVDAIAVRGNSVRYNHSTVMLFHDIGRQNYKHGQKY